LFNLSFIQLSNNFIASAPNHPPIPATTAEAASGIPMILSPNWKNIYPEKADTVRWAESFCQENSPFDR